MNQLLIFSLCLITLGCGYQHKVILNPITTPDGGRGFALQCREEAYCWELASKGCPNGYSIIDTNTSNGWSFGAGGGVAGGRSHRNMSMLVECK